MVSFISAAIAITLFGCFVVGLAISIGAPPFYVIALSVLAMAMYDFYESNIKKKNNGQS